MTMEDRQLEALLKQLPLRQPSMMLDQRIEQTLRQSHATQLVASGAVASDGDDGQAPPMRPHLFARHPWISLALAACLGVVAGLPLGLMFDDGDGLLSGNGLINGGLTQRDPVVPPGPGEVPQTTPLPTFDDHRVEMVWEQFAPFGTYEFVEGPPIQALRRQALERTIWYDPNQNATLEMTAPREEIVLVRQTPY